MKRRPLALAVLGLAGALACRSAGPRPPAAAPGEPAPDAIADFVGRRLILRQHGAQQRVSLARAELGRPAGDCDVGVEVHEARFAAGTATFKLEALGPASLADPPAARPGAGCGTVSGFLASVSGLAAGEAPEQMKADLGKLLAEPEAYLAAKGVAFDRAQGPEPKRVASRERNASFEERTLAQQVRSWPRALLRVEPFYRDPGGRVRHEGEVEFSAVVGEDGRLHGPKLRTPLSAAHEEHVLRALSLWRYEPARAEEPVAARIVERCTFRVY